MYKLIINIKFVKISLRERFKIVFVKTSRVLWNFKKIFKERFLY